MKLYCRHKEMRFGDARFPDGLIISNYTTAVDDEIGSRLALDHPDLFSMRKFAKADQVESVYKVVDETPADVESKDPPPDDSTTDRNE